MKGLYLVVFVVLIVLIVFVVLSAFRPPSTCHRYRRLQKFYLLLRKRKAFMYTVPLRYTRGITMEQTLRTKTLGGWGEEKASKLLKRAGFRSVRNLNSEIPNHLFADIYAERDNERFIIGVKTRNKQTAEGKLNSCYNICKKGKDLGALAASYKATPGWIAIQVEAEKRKCSAFFGTMAQIMVRANGTLSL